MLLVLNLIDRFFLRINSLFWTLWSYGICKFCGIKIGKRCTFFGKSKFKKLSTESKFLIGDNVCFRSGHTTNLIGVNRPCIFSLLTNEAKLTIGNNCGFSGTVIGCFVEIVIGDNVKCGANTLITDSDWHPEDSRSSEVKPIYIEDNVWLGVNVIVLKGVRIGQNSLIGAGSVVVKDIPANVVAAGNPCKVIRNLI
jgi:acetyltransferase-like isoleucine patch superfamily enzyme